MRIRVRTTSALAMLLWASLPWAVRAQGTARSLDIDTSVRAAGMGGASAGVWWGQPGVWGNPASLAEVRGIGWVQGRTRLVPGLAPDVWLKSSRLLLGGAGIGLSLMGEPLDGLGGERLDYGSDVGTDPFGNPTGTFLAYEKTGAWGIGLAPLQLLGALLGARGAQGVQPWRRVDVAGGLQRKHTEVALGPTPLGVPAADCVDWGVSGRVRLTPDLSPEAPWDLDLSGGYAVLNANDVMFDFGAGGTAPPSRIRRKGFAAHLSLPSPWSAAGGSRLIWLLSGEPHAAELGLAVDKEHVDAGGGPPAYDVERFGLELTLLGVLTVRVGHVTDRAGEIDGDTWGLGARVPIGPYASVGYDHASVPQAKSSGLPYVKRDGWSAWFDAVRLWSDVRAER